MEGITIVLIVVVTTSFWWRLVKWVVHATCPTKCLNRRGLSCFRGFSGLAFAGLKLNGEREVRNIGKRHIRVSKDWVDGTWISINPKPEILSSISSIMNSVNARPPPVPEHTC